MMVFEYQYSIDSPKIRVELVSDLSLTEIFNNFENFLFAAGYRFDGEINIIEENTNVEN